MDRPYGVYRDLTGADGYRVSFALAEFDPAFTDRVAILADRKHGMPLGGNDAPFQVILRDEKRPARWVRQLVSIEVRIPRCAADSGSSKGSRTFLVPLRGYEKGCSGQNIEFVGVAA